MNAQVAKPERQTLQSGADLASLPGPVPWPMLGNLPQLDLSRLHLQLERWADTHGPVYRIRLGRRDVLVISRADVIAGLLRDCARGDILQCSK